MFSVYYPLQVYVALCSRKCKGSVLLPRRWQSGLAEVGRSVLFKLSSFYSRLSYWFDESSEPFDESFNASVTQDLSIAFVPEQIDFVVYGQ